MAVRGRRAGAASSAVSANPSSKVMTTGRGGSSLPEVQRSTSSDTVSAWPASDDRVQVLGELSWSYHERFDPRWRGLRDRVVEQDGDDLAEAAAWLVKVPTPDRFGRQRRWGRDPGRKRFCTVTGRSDPTPACSGWAGGGGGARGQRRDGCDRRQHRQRQTLRPVPATSTTPSATRTVSETLTTRMTTSRSSRSGRGQCRATAAPGQNSMNTNAPATRKGVRGGTTTDAKKNSHPDAASVARRHPITGYLPVRPASGSWRRDRGRPPGTDRTRARPLRFCESSQRA